MGQRVIKRNQDVVQREVAGETFLVPIRGHLADLQELFVLNEVGSWVWARLEMPVPVEELAIAMSLEFDVDSATAGRDIEAFVEELREAGLVEEQAAAEA